MGRWTSSCSWIFRERWAFAECSDGDGRNNWMWRTVDNAQMAFDSVNEWADGLHWSLQTRWRWNLHSPGIWTTWKLFTKGLSPYVVKCYMRVQGSCSCLFPLSKLSRTFSLCLALWSLKSSPSVAMCCRRSGWRSTKMCFLPGLLSSHSIPPQNSSFGLPAQAVDGGSWTSALS